MVKINYANYKQLPESTDKKPKFELDDQYQVIMNPQAFLESFGAMDRFIAQMEKKGLITRNSNPDTKIDK